MWVKLADGPVFNAASARAIKVGPAGSAEGNWAIIAEMPNGEEIPLAEYHLPQTAQASHEIVVENLKLGMRFMELE
jgi:hypothetical protein